MGGVVFVGVFLTGVQHRAVVEQLHVAGLKTHLDMERRIVGDALGQCECRTLVVGESGRVGMALRIADVPGDEEDSRYPVDR